MKKSILLAFLALALPASAASIDWTMSTGLTSKNWMVDMDGNKLNGTAYLMLTSDATGTTFTSLSDITDLALGGAAGGVTITDGINKTTTTTTDSDLTAPTEYSFTVLVYDPAKNSYYLSAAKSQSAYNLSGDEYTDAKAISFTSENMYASSSTRNSQTWTSVTPAAVPEPSSAALALAGLALLLKRRRA